MVKDKTRQYTDVNKLLFSVYFYQRRSFCCIQQRSRYYTSISHQHIH